LAKDGKVVPGHWYLRLLTNDGSPFGHPGRVTEWLKTKTGGLLVPKSVSQCERCCFCWPGAPVSKVVDHSAVKCPLLATMNKYRANGNLQPIRVEKESFDTAAKKEPVKVENVAKEMEKEVRDLKGLIAGLFRPSRRSRA
jgi:hypothetical protein